MEGQENEKITGIRNYHDYRTLERIGIEQMLILIMNPEAPEGAEWRNYMDTPRPRRGGDEFFQTMIPASMQDVFGEEFLTENDWRLPEA